MRTAHSFIVYDDVCMPVYACMHMLACLQETFSPERPQNAQSFLDIGSGQSVSRSVSRSVSQSVGRSTCAWLLGGRESHLGLGVSQNSQSPGEPFSLRCLSYMHRCTG